jgi:hypothetical protein
MLILFKGAAMPPVEDPALTDLTISVIDHLVPRPAAGSAAGAKAPVSSSSVS